MPVDSAELAAIPLFGRLSEGELDELALWFDEKTVSEDVKLAGEGAPGYSFFVIVEGKAAVSSDGDALRALGPGDYFGEMAILGGGHRSATVTTTTPAKVLVMFGTEFRRLQEAHPEIASELEETMAQRRAAGE